MRAPTKSLLTLAAVAALAIPAGAQASGGADDGATELRQGMDDVAGHVRHSGLDDGVAKPTTSTTTSTRSTTKSKSKSCKRKRRGSRRSTRSRRTCTRHSSSQTRTRTRTRTAEPGDDHGAVNDDGPNHT